MADAPSIHYVEPVGIFKTVLNKVRNVAVEQVSQTLGWYPRLPGVPTPSPVRLEQPRHEFEKSIFAEARELRSRGLPTGYPYQLAPLRASAVKPRRGRMQPVTCNSYQPEMN